MAQDKRKAGRAKKGTSSNPRGTRKGSAKRKPQRRRPVLDAGDLLGGILSETEAAAKHEEQQIEEKLGEKTSAELREKDLEEERRRQAAEAALAEEAERQRKAEELRHRELELMIEPEPVRRRGARYPADGLPGPPLREGSGDYAAVVLPREMQSYMHAAVQAKPWPLWLRLSVGVVTLLVLAAALFFTVLKPEPPIDPTSYPKLALAFDHTGSQATMIGMAWIPRPEPDPATLQGAEGPEVAERDRHTRRRDRDRDRERDTSTPAEEEGGPSIQLDVDGPSIFERGSE